MILLRNDQAINAIIAAAPEEKRQHQIDLVKTLQLASERGKEKEVLEIFRGDAERGEGLSQEDKQFLDSVLEKPIFLQAATHLENHTGEVVEEDR
jgi:hypothetical protein